MISRSWRIGHGPAQREAGPRRSHAHGHHTRTTPASTLKEATMTTRTLITGAAVSCAIGLAATIAAPALAFPATPHIPATTTLTTEHTQSSGRQSIPYRSQQPVPG
jgi:hypothetical protein